MEKYIDIKRALLEKIDYTNPSKAKKMMESLRDDFYVIERKIHRQKQLKMKTTHSIDMATTMNRQITDYIRFNLSSDTIIQALDDWGHRNPYYVGRHYVAWADKIKKEQRNFEIWRRITISHEKKQHLADEFKITRQSVHRIYNQVRDNHPDTRYYPLLIKRIGLHR